MIIAVTMCRDEIDVLPHVLDHIAPQVDHVIVADNGSVDGTRQYLDQVATPEAAEARGCPVTVIDDPEPGYYQARKMTRLAHLAADMGATVIVPFDADEAWTLPPDLYHREFDVAHVATHLMIPRPDDDLDEVNPLRRIVHRVPEPEPHPKVMFRPHPSAVLHMGNHDVTWPDRLGPCRRRSYADVDVRHYQYRTFTQAGRKVDQGTAAYDATGFPAGSFGTHWRDLAGLDIAQRRDWWNTFQATPATLVAPLDPPAPR